MIRQQAAHLCDDKVARAELACGPRAAITPDWPAHPDRTWVRARMIALAEGALANHAGQNRGPCEVLHFCWFIPLSSPWHLTFAALSRNPNLHHEEHQLVDDLKTLCQLWSSRLGLTNSLVFAIEGMCRSHSLTMTARLNGVAFDLDRIGSSHLISLLLLGVRG